MSDILQTEFQNQVMDSLMDAPIVAQIPHEGAWRTSEENDSASGESLFDDNPLAGVDEALYEASHNRLKFGDEYVSKLESLEAEQEQEQREPHSSPEVREQWQGDEPAEQAQPQGAEQQVEELPEQVQEPSPQQVTEALQQYDTAIDQFQLSDVFPGQELPDALTFKPGMTLEDYKRIDSGLNKLQTAQGTQAQRDVANGYRQTAQQIALGNQQERQQATQDREEKQGLAWVSWQDKDGRTVAGPLSLAQKMGAQNPAQVPTEEIRNITDARQAVNLISKQGDPNQPETMGVLQLATL